MYVLNLAKDGRILSATYEVYTDGTIVDNLPNGNISDYKYLNGKFVHSPVIIPVHKPTSTIENRLSDIELLLADILGGKI